MMTPRRGLVISEEPAVRNIWVRVQLIRPEGCDTSGLMFCKRRLGEASEPVWSNCRREAEKEKKKEKKIGPVPEP